MAEHDVNTQEGFDAFMRAQEARAAGTDPDESPEGGEATDQEGQTAPPEPEAAPEVKEEDEDQDETAFQKGYAKALGEQSEKLGAERAAREALEQRLAALEAESQEQPPQDELITEEVWDELESLYEAQGGPGMMIQLANANASDDKLDAAIALWKENDFRNGELYEKRMNKVLSSMAAENEQEAPEDPDTAALKARAANEDAQKAILSEYGKEKLAEIQPHLEAALKNAPTMLRDSLAAGFQSADAERIVESFRTLAALAEPLAGATAPEDTPTPSVRAAKQAATVATGSQSRVSSGQSDDLPSTREELEALDPEDRKRAASKIMAQRVLSEETSVTRELERSRAAKAQ